MMILHDLYWLAYLITADRERSIQFAIGALDLEDAANPFFKSWITTWSRKLFIARVLGCVKQEIENSAQGTPARGSSAATNLRVPEFPGSAGKAELERALLAIDIFPRCAVLLTVFEKFPVEDVAILLNADRKLVVTARAIGLVELVRNLAEAVPAAQKAAA